jgi:3-hydroxyisobutyrate dehydrogenase-like beta-hydroxyacid dehydrogenase
MAAMEAMVKAPPELESGRRYAPLDGSFSRIRRVTRLGILHPGAMGSAVGNAARARASVMWASESRSEATRARAVAAGLEDAGSIDALSATVDVIISLVPPATARAIAERVAGAGFGGLYVDANAIAPRTAVLVAGVVEAAGARFIDGGVVGPPPITPGTTRLFLSGDRAGARAEIFEGSPLGAVVLGPEIGTASAMKMAYAAYTKGSNALLLAVRALAERHGLTGELLAEWDRSLPGLGDRSEAALRRAPIKAWRFAGEMEEIAETFRAAGLPGGFHDAASEVYGRVGPEGPEVDDGSQILGRITGSRRDDDDARA